MMKLRLVLLAISLAAFSQIAAAQNTIKLFDPIAIDVTTKVGSFGTKQISLTCPAGGSKYSALTGPNGGPFIVDNYVLINGSPVSRDVFNMFDGLLASPMSYVGEPMEMAYTGINPVDVTSAINKSGSYTFDLNDNGYTYGSTELNLVTDCWIAPDQTVVTGETQICHRNMGQAGFRTLNVGAASLAAHLAHGDTEGSCSAN
jgi:hypothetical protein